MHKTLFSLKEQIYKFAQWIYAAKARIPSKSIFIVNDKTNFVLLVCCAEFALRKQHISNANSCASPLRFGRRQTCATGTRCPPEGL